MARQIVIPGGVMLNETGARQVALPGSVMVSEDQMTITPPTGIVPFRRRIEARAA